MVFFSTSTRGYWGVLLYLYFIFLTGCVIMIVRRELSMWRSREDVDSDS